MINIPSLFQRDNQEVVRPLSLRNENEDIILEDSDDAE
jgi:hypothetical protein